MAQTADQTRAALLSDLDRWRKHDGTRPTAQRIASEAFDELTRAHNQILTAHAPAVTPDEAAAAIIEGRAVLDELSHWSLGHMSVDEAGAALNVADVNSDDLCTVAESSYDLAEAGGGYTPFLITALRAFKAIGPLVAALGTMVMKSATRGRSLDQQIDDAFLTFDAKATGGTPQDYKYFTAGYRDGMLAGAAAEAVRLSRPRPLTRAHALDESIAQASAAGKTTEEQLAEALAANALLRQWVPGPDSIEVDGDWLEARMQEVFKGELTLTELYAMIRAPWYHKPLPASSPAVTTGDHR